MCFLLTTDLPSSIYRDLSLPCVFPSSFLPLTSHQWEHCDPCDPCDPPPPLDPRLPALCDPSSSLPLTSHLLYKPSSFDHMIPEMWSHYEYCLLKCRGADSRYANSSWSPTMASICTDDTTYILIYYNETVCLGYVLEARENIMLLRGISASLVTPALTVAPLEPRWGKSVCSLISQEADPRRV